MAVTDVSAAGAVLMVRPAAFCANAETAGDNRFQKGSGALGGSELLSAVQREWDGLADALDRLGVRVCAFESRLEDETPDALYPNNWLSTHADGRVVLYPMYAANRRRERRSDIVAALSATHGYRVSEVCDLSPLERAGLYVEGTGSLVIDRGRQRAYACRSMRTHPLAVARVAELLGYTVCEFSAVDRERVPIYHTNVMLALGTGYAVVCLESVDDDAERHGLRADLTATGRELIDIGLSQVAEFAANVLELRGRGDARHLAMSARALAAFTPAQRRSIERYAAILAVPVPHIEAVGGGGVRCLLAEIFLPPMT